MATGTNTVHQNEIFDVEALSVGGTQMASTPAEIDATTTGGLTGGATTVAADELVIPITHAFVNKTTGGDAEALSLADGTVGQMLTVYLGTDGGGTGTLTPSTAAGFVSLDFADAGDMATLQMTNDGWVLRSHTGVTVNFS